MSFYRTFADPAADMQRPFDVAVIMPSILRPSLGRALDSIFAQDFPGRVQVLVGIDIPSGDPAMIEACCRRRPPNVAVQLLYPGYSTAGRHGGLYPAADGGALRCLLGYLANSRYLVYLDDDNWWAADHLRLVTEAVQGHDWAFGYRWFTHPETGRTICLDNWESVGPGRGVFARSGGWVDPNCLILDKIACDPILRWWTIPMPGDGRGMAADRHVFHHLSRRYRWRSTDRASVYYQLSPADGLHSRRLQVMGERWEQAGK